MMGILYNPDCMDAKHRACSGDGWCESTDRAVPCPCECHGGPVGAEHYPGCPCGACQSVRAVQPTTHAIQARHLSGASIGKLVEWEVGRDLATGAHVWSPAGTLTHVWHGEGSTEISVNHDYPDDYADTLDQIGLQPDQWVRVTQTTAKDTA